MINFSSKEQRKTEEQLYAVVVDEIERNEINKALWAKALADSDNDENKTRALYIKYRVQKLKDEISDNQEAQRQQQRAHEQTQAKQQKDHRNVGTLTTTVEKTVSTFHWLILLMVLISLATLFFGYIFYDSGDEYWIAWCIGGAAFLGLGLWLYVLTRQISKTTDFNLIKRKLNVLFTVLIPFTFVAMAIGFLAPLIGLLAFIAFVSLSIRAIKFNLAFRYAKKNNLI